MLAARMVQIAVDLRNEADTHRLIELLNSAKNLSAQRNQLGEGGYRQEAKKIRERANQILSHTVFKNYPLEEYEQLKESAVSSLLPERVSRLILAAIPATDMGKAAASPEFDLYINEASQIYGEVSGFLSFARSLGVEEYHVAEGLSSLEILLPRSSFKNEISSFGHKLSVFDRFFASIAELSAGERVKPNLVYISTSDPIIFLEWLPVAVMGALAVYNPILDAAERTANLAKTIKDLLGIGADQKMADEMKRNLAERNEQTIRDEVARAVERIRTPLVEPRLTEVRTEITILSIQIVNEVAKGARISVGAGDRGAPLPPYVDANGAEQPAQGLMVHQRIIEDRIQQLYDSIGDRQQLLEHLPELNEDTRQAEPKK